MVDGLAGQGTVTFDDGWNAYEIPWVFLDLPGGGGVVFETVAGEMTMTFPFTNPLPIVQNDSGQHWACLHWHIFESFRWQDLGYVGYVDAQWDTSTVTTLGEIVWVPGVIGYQITSSAD